MDICIHCQREYDDILKHFEIYHQTALPVGSKVEITKDVEIHGVNLKKGMKGSVVEDPYCCCEQLAEISLAIEGIKGYLGVPFDVLRVTEINGAVQ